MTQFPIRLESILWICYGFVLLFLTVWNQMEPRHYVVGAAVAIGAVAILLIRSSERFSIKKPRSLLIILLVLGVVLTGGISVIVGDTVVRCTIVFFVWLLGVILLWLSRAAPVRQVRD